MAYLRLTNVRMTADYIAEHRSHAPRPERTPWRALPYQPCQGGDNFSRSVLPRPFVDGRALSTNVKALKFIAAQQDTSQNESDDAAN